jgi:hypothetical protein
MMSQNGKLLTQIMNNLDKPSKFKRPKNQWQDPGEITTIPSDSITMQGVSYPVYAQPDFGPGGMMMPGQDYYFPGASNVTEYPMMAGGGYVVTKTSERKGKTHKVTGPDGTVKYFGDAKLGQHPKDPERKKAFYARHKKNLAANPYFRAFARETWEEGGLIKFQKGGEDSTLENIAEIIDPTGISSWDDVYRSYKESGISPQTALELLGALPLIGKAGKVTKAGIHLAKYKGIDKMLHKGLPKSAMLSKTLQGLGLAGRGSDAVQAVQQASSAPLFPFGGGGEMIRRADGSYSRRGLWDNIRANKGSGKKPTKEMLEQERKIKAKEMKYGGTNNPGFEALPDYVQANILSNMAYGGMSYPFMQDGGDPDGGMALGQIAAVMDKMDKLRQFIQPNSDLEPWISSKLAVMDHYADAVSDYMMYNPEAQEMMMMDEEGLPMEQMSDGGSIVNFLTSRRIDSSKANRAKLAKEYGVNNYDYSAEKNTELLNILRSKLKDNAMPVKTPIAASRTATPPPVKAKSRTSVPQEKEVVIDNRNVFQRLFNMDEETVRRFNLPVDVYDAYEKQKTGNKGKNFGIVSKKNARAYFFDPEGNLAVQDEVGFGQDKGEEQPIFYQRKTTPSGTYKMARPRVPAPVADRVFKGYDAKNFFYMDNLDPNKKLVDAPGSTRTVAPRQAMHGIPKHLINERSKAFGNDNIDDNYMSAGCINCKRPFLDNPYFDKFNEGLVYVLPEQESGGYIGHDGKRHMSNTPTWAGTYGYAMGGFLPQYEYQPGGPVAMDNTYVSKRPMPARAMTPKNVNAAFDYGDPKTMLIDGQIVVMEGANPDDVTSLVDYLDYSGVDYSKANRAKLAKFMGVNNYDYSAGKNTELLNLIKSNNNRFNQVPQSFVKKAKGGLVAGQVIDNITKQQAEMLRAQGYEFEII